MVYLRGQMTGKTGMSLKRRGTMVHQRKFTGKIFDPLQHICNLKKIEEEQNPSWPAFNHDTTFYNNHILIETKRNVSKFN